MKNKFFFIIISFISILLLLLFFVLYLSEKTSISHISMQKLASEKDLKLNHLSSYMKNKEYILTKLINNESFLNYVEYGDNEELIKKIFLSIVSTHDYINQFRFIDYNGNEVLRVNHNDGDARAVSFNNLKNEHNRYYFQDTMFLNNGQINYSNIDINAEDKKQIYPIVPTIRLSTPVDIGDVRYGILIVNLDLTQFIKDFQDSTYYDISLVYGNGDIIIHKNEEYNWSRCLGKNLKIYNINRNVNGDFYKYDKLLMNDHIKISKVPLLMKDDVYLMLETRDFDNMKELYTSMSFSIQLLILFAAVSLPIGYLLASYIEKTIENESILKAKISENILFNSVVNSNRDVIFYKDKDLKYIGCNKKFERLIGKKLDDIKGKTDHDIFDLEVATKSRQVDKKVLESKSMLVYEKWMEYENKKEYIQIKKIPFKYDNKNIGILGIGSDITKIYKSYKNMEKESYTDALTGIGNRRSYEYNIKEEIKLYNRYRESFCLVLFDIDFFKKINDSFGHDVGDQVLVKLVNHVNSVVRDSDKFFRVGGEEFIVILKNTKILEASLIAEKIREHVQNSTLIENYKVTISLGVTQVTVNDECSSIYKRVDTLLYQSKNSGRNTVTRG